jgi:hypothetical protein
MARIRMSVLGRQASNAVRQPGRLLSAPNQPLILRFSICQILRLLLRQ